MREVIVIHFQPLEGYPPITNILTMLGKENAGNTRITVLTTAHYRSFSKRFDLDSANITIERVGSINPDSSIISRMSNYFKFYAYSLLVLLRKKAQDVIYFETISAFPALAYHCLFNPKSRISVHYHEYTAKPEYKTGMVLVRWAHAWEVQTYNSYSWISHTNKRRLEMFLADNPSVSGARTHILPNFPPASWAEKTMERKPTLPVRMIYIGALSLETMYLRELTEWIGQHGGRITLDIFSNNFTKTAKAYVEALQTPYISFKGPLEYYSLPEVARGYHIGVIMYRGVSDNHIESAPNKLFEYHSCGLDVWFPHTIRGSYPFITTQTYPKVTPINFEDLQNLDLTAVMDRAGLRFRIANYSCERVLRPILRNGAAMRASG